MSNQWEYQVRIYLGDEFAEVARRNPDDPAIKPLADILNKQNAIMRCQFDAFAAYVAEAENYLRLVATTGWSGPRAFSQTARERL